MKRIKMMGVQIIFKYRGSYALNQMWVPQKNIIHRIYICHDFYEKSRQIYPSHSMTPPRVKPVAIDI